MSSNIGLSQNFPWFTKTVLLQLKSYLHVCISDIFQSGFKAYHSTPCALLQAFTDIFVSTDSGDSAVLILLDLMAAFTTIAHDILISCLEHCVGDRDTTLLWFSSFCLMLYICLRDGSARLASNMKGVPCRLAKLRFRWRWCSCLSHSDFWFGVVYIPTACVAIWPNLFLNYCSTLTRSWHWRCAWLQIWQQISGTHVGHSYLWWYHHSGMLWVPILSAFLHSKADIQLVCVFVCFFVIKKKSVSSSSVRSRYCWQCENV